MNETKTRYFLNLDSTIVTVQYATTDAHPDYVPYVQNAIDVTDRVRKIEGMLEYFPDNKHGVVVRAPDPAATQWTSGPSDPIGDINRACAIIEAQSEAIFQENPEYVPAWKAAEWLSEGKWHVDGTRTGRIPCDGSNVEQEHRGPVFLEDGDMEAGNFFHKEWFATESAVLTKDEEAVFGLARAPGKYHTKLTDLVTQSRNSDLVIGPGDPTAFAGGKYYVSGPTAGIGEILTAQPDGSIKRETVEPEEDHTGMVQNPITGKWSWGFL